MGPSVDLLFAHCVKDVAELLYVALGVILGFFPFVPVEFFVVELEIAVVVSLCTVGVFATTYTVLALVVVMMLLGWGTVLVKAAQQQKTTYNKN